METISAQQFLQTIFKNPQKSSDEHVCLIMWQNTYYMGTYQPFFNKNLKTHGMICILKVIPIDHDEYLELLADYPTLCISHKIRLFDAKASHIVTLVNSEFAPLSEKDTNIVTSVLRYVSNVGLEMSYQTA